MVQPHIDYDFRDKNDNAWAPQCVDTYNRFTDLINRHHTARQGTLAYDEREFYLDQRHKFYVQCAIAVKSNKQATQAR